MLVYWIHYKEHQNPYEEGYIGITNNLEQRIKQHSSSRSKCKHVLNRINNGSIITVLHHDISLKEAISLEEKYRPKENIGWNICKGGGYPPKQTGEFLDTNRLIGEERTENQKEASKEHSKRMKGKSPWNKGKKGLQNHSKETRQLMSKSKKGKPKEVVTCPHCKTQGGLPSMKRWHFDNCQYGG